MSEVLSLQSASKCYYLDGLIGPMQNLQTEQNNVLLVASGQNVHISTIRSRDPSLQTRMALLSPLDNFFYGLYNIFSPIAQQCLSSLQGDTLAHTSLAKETK